jgi:hypothetical protein
LNGLDVPGASLASLLEKAIAANATIGPEGLPVLARCTGVAGCSGKLYYNLGIHIALPVKWILLYYSKVYGWL